MSVARPPAQARIAAGLMARCAGVAPGRRRGPGLAAWAALVGITLAGCGEAKHEPVRVIAQPRAEAPQALAVPPAPPPASAPVPAASVASAPATPPPRGLDAGPRPGLVSTTPPQRLWQPGEPNGNADFRAALEARQQSRGQAAPQP